MFLLIDVFLYLEGPQILPVLHQNAVWIELLSFLAFEELGSRVPSSRYFRVDSGVEGLSAGSFRTTLLTQLIGPVTQHNALVIADRRFGPVTASVDAHRYSFLLRHFDNFLY